MAFTRLFDFDDPYSYMSSVRAADVRLVPTGRGQFHADLRQVTFQRLWMQRSRENLPRISHSAVTSKRVAIDFLSRLDQPSMWNNGIEVSPVEIVINSSTQTHKRSLAPCEWGAMSLSVDDFAAAGRLYLGRELVAPAASTVVRPTPVRMARLLRLHRLAGRLASRAPERLAHPQVSVSLENALTHAFVTCLSEGAPTQESLGQRRHTAILAKLEDFLISQEGMPVHLAALRAATGVSERTLRNCFHERFGMGPIRYLWLRRMNQVCQALLLADPAESTVTDIATAYGFWELGRFSVAYRRLFGERPSATLHRPGGCRPTPASGLFTIPFRSRVGTSGRSVTFPQSAESA